MPANTNSDMQNDILAAFTDDSFLKDVAEALMKILMPKIVENLKRLNVFNAEFSHEYEEYKKEQEERYTKTRLEEARKLDSLEQYESLDSVRINGVEEGKNEDTADVVSKMMKRDLKVKIEKSDINIAHRLGPAKNDSEHPRAIIVKFLRRSQRLEILQNRKTLKG